MDGTIGDIVVGVDGALVCVKLVINYGNLRLRTREKRLLQEATSIRRGQVSPVAKKASTKDTQTHRTEAENRTKHKLIMREHFESYYEPSAIKYI